jgi:hypothetical protein
MRTSEWELVEDSPFGPDTYIRKRDGGCLILLPQYDWMHPKVLAANKLRRDSILYGECECGGHFADEELKREFVHLFTCPATDDNFSRLIRLHHADRFPKIAWR